ncbi:hypothetical protein [Pediococcus inopinatus]|uniref:hypothetical protein n=1 Tax=Pediococcus inopinatus TaxID=114090 RepID=UPI00070E92FF|nr:hypothetical protein [Pediococcus inopinatus]AVK99673.1 hypothetical protein PI20285_02860 [Pediococcus inopinatus]KRN57714.1 hypothetical protein IV83_GL002001 [Pediococcus inopinatus]
MDNNEGYLNLFKNPTILKPGQQMVVKFVLPEYVKDLLSGKIYMRQLKFFKGLEDEQRGDKHEGTWRQSFSDGEIKMESSISYKFVDEIQIACFTLLDKERDFYKLNDSWYMLKPNAAKNLEKIREKRDAVFYDANDFLQSLVQTNKNNPDFTWSMIEYTNCMQKAVNNEFRMQHIEGQAFIKDSFFANQRELRLMKIESNKKDSTNIQLLGPRKYRHFAGSALNLRKLKISAEMFA